MLQTFITIHFVYLKKNFGIYKNATNVYLKLIPINIIVINILNLLSIRI